VESVFEALERVQISVILEGLKIDIFKQQEHAVLPELLLKVADFE